MNKASLPLVFLDNTVSDDYCELLMDYCKCTHNVDLDNFIIDEYDVLLMAHCISTPDKD